MLRHPGRSLVALMLAATTGCAAPSADPSLLSSAGDGEPSTGASEGSATAGETGATTAGSGASGASGAGDSSTGSSATGEAGETGEATASTTAASSDGPPPALPPRIVDTKLTPTLLSLPGAVSLEVETEAVEWVEAKIDGAPLELTQVEPQRFVAEIAVISELSDGTHTIALRPFSGQDEGKTAYREFTSDLPEAGTEAYWEASSGLGEGLAGALIPGPGGEMYEFGTLDPAGTPRCYLRRRNPDGTWGPNDVIEVAPGKHCTAIDTALEPDGRLLLLSEIEEFGATAWRLDRHAPWNHSLAMVLLGTPDSKGNAIAVASEGQVVVCGSTPTEADDRDMAIWGSKPGFLASFDLVYDNEHSVSETAHDCVFVGETLVLAGDAHGKHPGDPVDYTRHTVLEYELDTKETKWTVAPIGEGPLVQSSAQAIATDGKFGYVTAGHVCGSPCLPQLELRAFKLGGELEHTYRPAAKTTTATAVAWHPAGYAVVTAGELKGGWWSKMWAQAWIPGQTEPLWTFSRSDTEGVHWALDVAIGQFGYVHVIGVVELGDLLVPAFVTLYP